MSPDGERVAIVTDDGAESSTARVSWSHSYKGVAGNAWSPAGDEIWWLKAPKMVGYAQVQSCELHATNPRGRDRVLITLPGDYVAARRHA